MQNCGYCEWLFVWYVGDHVVADYLKPERVRSKIGAGVTLMRKSYE
jgi:hypothetical protein